MPDSVSSQSTLSPDAGTLTEFGFTWGPLAVSRCASFERANGRSRVVQIKAGGRTIDIYVSETGRSIRVFSEGQEWKP